MYIIMSSWGTRTCVSMFIKERVVEDATVLLCFNTFSLNLEPLGQYSESIEMGFESE